MGFPVAYSEFTLPKFVIHVLSILGFIRNSLVSMFSFLGLSHVPEPNNHIPSNQTIQSRTHKFSFISASLVREILNVAKFSEVVNPPESCAICLHGFEDEDEIRPLANCCHIFHRTCLDPWIGYEQRTCPLCRKSLLPFDMINEKFSERAMAASGMFESYDEFFQAELFS